MHRSSESFAALAAALAKAQAHLVNPEKSLTATIAGGRPGERARSFRYAPLSSGLEIVRKTLSEHEIAVIQTTAVDQASRMLTPHHAACPFIGRMDRVLLAGLLGHRNCQPATDRRGADLCPPLCPLHAGRHCR